MLDIIIFYIKFGGIAASLSFFIFLATYCLLKFFSGGLKSLVKRKSSSDDFIFFRGIFLIFIVSFIFFAFAGFALIHMSFNIPVEKISFFDNYFMQIDKTIFGRYLPFWFQDSNNQYKPIFDFFGFFIVQTYKILAFFLGILLILLLLFNPNYFCKAFLSFGLTILISLPLWFLFPAVTPLDAYIYNVTNTPVPNGLQFELAAYSPNKSVSNFFKFVKDIGGENNNHFFYITTMPSMHIAWSLIILYFGILLWRPSAILLIPYFLVNALSTIYLLQHYTIDILAGLIVGAISIWLATVIIKNKTPKFVLHISKSFWLDLQTSFHFSKW